jgi:hypothetical protein
MAYHTPIGCWPTAAQEALLCAVLLDGDAAAAAFDAWRRAVDARTLDEGSRRLLPALYRNLARLGIRTPLLDELKDLHRRSWYRNQILFHDTARVVGAFAEAGIDTLLLKGVPLALECYPDAASRPMADVDILVRPDAVVRAVDLLARTGWRPDGTPLGWPAEPRNAWTFIGKDAREVDLHWRVFRAGRVSEADIWSAAVPLDVMGVATRAPCLPDLFLHVLAHGLVWNPVPSIRWIADAVLILRRGGDTFDWTRVFEQARARGWLPTLHRALSYLGGRFEVPLPAAVRADLDAFHATSAERIALWAQMHPGVVAGTIRTWDDYARYAADSGRRRTPVGFVRYLNAFWQITRRGLPAKVADRVRHRWRSH